MQFASIGSGSAGNGLVVKEKNTRLLLDCGFGLKDSIERLARINISPEQLTGILITHEHEDHAGGVFKLAKKYQLDVWMTHGTHRMLERALPIESVNVHIIDSHTEFCIDDIQITPFPVPHDARIGIPKPFIIECLPSGSATP